MAEDIDDVPPESIELRRFELHSLWRVLFWGASAAMAVAVVAGTAFSDLGADRLKQTLASLIETARTTTQTETPTLQAQTTPQIDTQQLAALEKQTRELTQTVRELTTERDRVKARLASLEQNFDDITGAIRKQTAQSTQVVPQLPPKQAAATPPPVISAPQTVAAIPSPSANSATPAPDTPITTAISAPAAADASPPLDGPIPLPPMRTAALENPAATIRELGVDVGGATTLDALRANWAALKANVGPELVGLAPSFTVRQRQSGGNDYRLVLGPLPNSTAALRLCAKLIAARVNCRAGTYNVERLAERQQPAPARAVEQLPTPARDSIVNR